MERLGNHVLTDPAYRMPGVEPGETGLAWLRQHVVRFSDGDCHIRRRGLAEQIVHEVMQATFVVSPTVSLLRAMGMPDELADDVALVAASYQPHLPQNSEADAAADRLVEACGGRDEESAARVCVLVQGHAATKALIARRHEGSDIPPVPTTRRVRDDGTIVEVDLADAHFGRGPHRCPAEELARRLAQEALS
jgi:cytochrome P450